MAELSQYEAWLDADEFDRLADVLERVTSFHDENGIIALRSYLRVDDIENTSDFGVVDIILISDPESDSPYYALLYDGPATDPRASFMLSSSDLRELAARLRAANERTDGAVITLENVDDGTRDSEVHPQIQVQRKPEVTDQAVAHLWFDYLERFPTLL